ncbi:MAG: translation initiation factor 2 [Lachnospiraceae bacterium]|nr:translation initiation factor 2 [Lachnospiraceae bacterium]
MKGKYFIEVYSNKLKYEMTIQRNITVIRGNSATGKTQLVNMIRDYNTFGADSGIVLNCDRNCVVVEGVEWKKRILELTDAIIFIDEGNGFVRTDEFARLINHNSNYFVLVTREKLSALPYSVKEIYGFRESNKYGGIRQVFNEAYPLFHELSVTEQASHSIIVTEDSNSGWDFFNMVAGNNQMSCISAKGKSNVLNTVIKLDKNTNTVLAVVDGSAFGSEMDDVVEYIRYHKTIALYAPESFEWMILKSGIVAVPDAILSHTCDYVDSCEHLSWERFFTQQLISVTQNTIYHYSKHKLNPAYLSQRNIDRILSVMKSLF